jgi:predicted RNase H-like HicB family nuclease
MRAKIALYTDEDGIWVAECLSMPGCVTQGDTRGKALENIREAMQGWLEAMAEEDPDISEHLPDIEICEIDVAA